LTTVVVLPTPPFWLAQAMIWPTQVPISVIGTFKFYHSGPVPGSRGLLRSVQGLVGSLAKFRRPFGAPYPKRLYGGLHGPYVRGFSRYVDMPCDCDLVGEPLGGPGIASAGDARLCGGDLVAGLDG
jgi:hypothetical protein